MKDISDQLKTELGWKKRIDMDMQIFVKKR